MRKLIIGMASAWCLLATLAHAQEVGGQGRTWRGAGPQPCFGIDGAANKCPTGPQTVAIRAGRLFDSKSDTLLSDQVVLIQGDRITALTRRRKFRFPPEHVIDLSRRPSCPA
jgi:hypothetical protein